MSLSPASELLKQHLRAYGIPFEEEYRFDEKRKWRADFRVGSLMLNFLVEIDGGNRMAKMVKGKPVAVGRHTLPEDYRKLNAATLQGWSVLRFTPAMVKSGEAIDTIREALK